MSYTTTIKEMKPLHAKLKYMSADEVLVEVEKYNDREDEKMMMNVGILDDILHAFHQEHPFDQAVKATLRGYKNMCSYKYNGKKWMANIYDHCWYDSTTPSQRTFKFSHNGFKYHARKFVQANHTTHKRDSWYLLGGDVLEEMPFLRHLGNLLHADSITFAYNIKHKRADIKFFKSEDDEVADTPFVLVTFEYYPAEDPVEKKAFIKLNKA